MSAKLPLADIISNLEARIAFHQEQASHHAQRAEHHLEQRALHEAELKQVTEHCEALKAAAPAAELVRPIAAPAKGQEIVSGPPPTVSRMVQEVVAALPDGEPFGLTNVTKELNERFKAALKRPVDVRIVSAVLRRMLDHGRIRLVREGRPYYEALYAKGSPAVDAPIKSSR